MIRSVFCLLLTISFFVMVAASSDFPVFSPVAVNFDCGEHKNGETFQKEHPCQEYTCTNGFLGVKPCIGVPILEGSGCRRGTGKGPYPICCHHPVCPGDPGF
ncbi:uncharacterized protein [Parasteatoda tepidariorum]|uniref:uncharacterized protein n=1 Tax=Parasteatoda tepidariorum TaxID=114398 RepID=UPI00077FE127